MNKVFSGNIFVLLIGEGTQDEIFCFKDSKLSCAMYSRYLTGIKREKRETRRKECAHIVCMCGGCKQAYNPVCFWYSYIQWAAK